MPLTETIYPLTREEPSNGPGVCPWSGSRFGVVSLLDVLRYAAEEFVEITKILTSLETNPRSLRDERVLAKFQQCLEMLHDRLTS